MSSNKKFINNTSCKKFNDVIEMTYGQDVIWKGNFDRNIQMKVVSLIDKMKLNDILFTGKAYEQQSSLIRNDPSRFGLYCRDDNYNMNDFMSLLLKTH